MPLHDTAVAGLKRYLARRRPRSEADLVFVDARGLSLRYIADKETSDRLVGRAGIVPAAKRHPRPHDELWLIFGDGVNQAADFFSDATSIPSRNVTPLTTFGN